MLAVLVLIIAGVLAAVASGAGTRWVVAQVEQATAGPDSSAQVRVDAVAGSLLGHLALRGLSLSDAQGAWLTIDHLDFDWSPWRLLAGRLRIDQIAAGIVDVQRAPVSAAKTEAGDEETFGGGFDPLMLGRLSLRGLSVDKLALGESLLGQKAALKISAQTFGTTLGGIEATTSITRLDGDTSVTAKMTYSHARSLGVHAVIHDVQGGLLGTLTGLPDAPAVSLTVDGQGPLDAWGAEVFGEIPDIAQLNGDVTLSLGDTLSAHAEGQVKTGSRVPPTLASLLAPTLTFDVDAKQDEAGALRVDHATFGAGDWAVLGSASMGADGTLDARMDVALSDGRLVQKLAGVPLDDATAVVTLTGSLDHPRAMLELTSSGSYADHATLAVAVDRLSGGAMQVALQGAVSDWGPMAQAWSGVSGTPVRLSLSGTLNEDQTAFSARSLAVTTPTADLSGKADVSWDGPVSAKADVTAKMGDLSVLAPLSGLDLHGASTVAVALSSFSLPANGGLPDVSATVRVDGQQIALGIPEADRMVGGTVSLSSDVRVKDGTARLDNLALSTPGATAQGTVSIARLDADAPTLGGSLNLEVPDLSRLDATVTGGVSLPMELAGSLSAPTVTGTLHGKRLELAGVAVRRLVIPLTASPTQVSVHKVDVAAAGLSVSGGVDLALSPLAADGTLSIAADDPAALKALAGVDLGKARAEVRLLPPKGKGTQSATLSVDAEDIRARDAGVRVASARVRGHLTHLFSGPEGTVRIETEKLRHSAVRFKTLTVDAALKKGASLLVADISGEGRAAAPFDVKTSVSVPLDGTATAVTVSSLDLTSDPHQVSLRQPLELRQVGSGWQVRQVALSLDKGTVDGSARIGGGRLQVALTGRSVPMDLADLVVKGFPLKGTLDLDADISGSGGTARLQAHDVAMPDADVSGLGADVALTLARGSANVTGTVSGLGDQPVKLVAALPMRTGADGIPLPVTDKPLSASVDWHGPLARVWALVPVVGHRLTGTATLKATVDGTMDQPHFAGTARIADGRYENLQWGTVLDALSVTASLQDSGAVDVQATATDGGKGTVKAEAHLDAPKPGSPPDVNATITVAHAALVRRDDLRVRLGGDIHYAGALGSGALTGKLTTEGVQVQLTDSLGGGVQTLPVSEVHRQEAGLRGPERTISDEIPAQSPITLDLTVLLPNQVFVRGQGLESEWKGNLHVGGNAAQPTLKGDLSVVRGSFALIGKTFTLDTGTITFAGGTSIDPALDIEAVYSTDDLEATVTVDGTASKPSLTLGSTPSLPSDEILSRVLFGTTVGKLSAAQALSVAQAAASLSGGGGGLNISDMLRTSLGLDVVSFGGGNDDDSTGTLQVGKYVAKGVYVGVEQGLSADSSAVSVEVDLTPRVSVETKASAAEGADVGVNYKFDY